jgi:VWFA-related protein
MGRTLAQYKSYRRFSADSSVKYDTDSGDTGVTVAAPQPRAFSAPVPEPIAIAEIKEVAPPELPESALEPPPQVLVVPLKVVPLKNDEPSAAPTPDPVFRAATRLVQVSVIAQDKNGKPVTDVRRDEFQISDNDAPQEIRLFLADHSDPDAPAPQTPGTFTNRIGSNGASILLFDKLFVESGNGVFAHNVHARQRALQALKAIPPGDRIAIYSLGCRFEVVRELTSDRDSILARLNAFLPGSAPCADPEIPSNNPHEVDAYREIAARHEADLGEYEFNVMADHLAGIPGRKNLIWVTSMFRLSPPNVKRLIDANVAIYPVDIIGSWVAPDWAKKARYDPLRAFAAMTGGVAFYDRDDTDVGIRQALRDGRDSYTLGFYPSSEDTSAPVHRLGIRVARPGVTLRYRTTYEVKLPLTSANPADDMVRALNRPVDATVIPVTARATRNGDHVDLSVSLDVSTLDLELGEGLWKGQVELVSRFMTADGLPAGAPSAQTMTFNLRPATYESMLKGADPYRTELPIPAKATELKVLVANIASGKIGTLTIPLSEIVP